MGYGLGDRVLGFGFWVLSLGFLALRGGLGVRVLGLGFWVSGFGFRASGFSPCGPQNCERALEREFFIDNLLVRIHFIIVMIWWTGLAPWEFESPFPGSLASTFLGLNKK